MFIVHKPIGVAFSEAVLNYVFQKHSGLVNVICYGNSDKKLQAVHNVSKFKDLIAFLKGYDEATKQGMMFVFFKKGTTCQSPFLLTGSRGFVHISTKPKTFQANLDPSFAFRNLFTGIDNKCEGSVKDFDLRKMIEVGFPDDYMFWFEDTINQYPCSINDKRGKWLNGWWFSPIPFAYPEISLPQSSIPKHTPAAPVAPPVTKALQVHRGDSECDCGAELSTLNEIPTSKCATCYADTVAAKQVNRLIEL